MHGGQQEHGVHYWDTYAPVVTWQTVLFFFYTTPLTRVAQPAIGFCHGVHTSTFGDAPLPALAPRIQTEGHYLKIPRAQAQTQRLWAKASRKSLESLHGPGDEGHRFYPEQV